MDAARFVLEAWIRVAEVLSQLEQRADVVITTIEPNASSLNPRFYVLLDHPEVVAQLSLWDDCTLRVEALDVRSGRSLLQDELQLRAPDEIIACVQTLVELLHHERLA